MPENDTRITQVIVGAALGVAGLLALVMIGMVVLYLNADTLLESRGDALRENLTEIHGNMVRDGKIPTEHSALMDDLVSRGARSDSGVVAPWMVTGVLIQTLDDGELSADELALVEGTVEFLKENPAPNPITMSAYLEKHPELEATVSRIQEQHP